MKRGWEGREGSYERRGPNRVQVEQSKRMEGTNGVGVGGWVGTEGGREGKGKGGEGVGENRMEDVEEREANELIKSMQTCLNRKKTRIRAERKDNAANIDSGRGGKEEEEAAVTVEHTHTHTRQHM